MKKRIMVVPDELFEVAKSWWNPDLVEVIKLSDTYLNEDETVEEQKRILEIAKDENNSLPRP